MPATRRFRKIIARLQDLLDTISGAKGSSKVNPVKFLTSQQSPDAKQDDGLLVAGTVKAIQPAGRLFELMLDATRRIGADVADSVDHEPRRPMAVGDVLVVVGRVLHEPSKHLPGYEGGTTQVLLLGQAVRGPTQSSTFSNKGRDQTGAGVVRYVVAGSGSRVPGQSRLPLRL